MARPPIATGPLIIGRDFSLEVALGNVSGYATLSKFGGASDCDSGVNTDLWDGADGATSTDIWVAPTTARTHDIASASANDTSAGTGMRTCRVFGLASWTAAEVSEDITMNGTTNVPTARPYIIIHRIKALTFGSGETNAGIITATAQTDTTITAAIQAGRGQTGMLIYGLPSTKALYLKAIRLYVLKNAATVEVNAKLLVRENANLATSGYIIKELSQFQSTVPLSRYYEIPKVIEGPAIVKIQVNTDTDGAGCVGAFDAYLVDN